MNPLSKALTRAAELPVVPARPARGHSVGQSANHAAGHPASHAIEPQRGQSQVQSRCQSLIETMVQTALGFITNFAAGFLIYPMVGMPMPAVSNLLITLLFTVLSLKRGYWLRRFFVWYWARGRG